MSLFQRAHHRGWRVGTKLLGLIIPLVALVTIMTAWGLHERNTAKLHEKLIQRARSLHTQIMADREYYAAVILPRIRQLGGSFGADYRRVHGQFPLPATFVREVSARTTSAQEGYKANLISPWPINQDQGIKDQFQRDAFAYLMANPSGQFFRADTSEGRAVMRVLMADRASAQSCVSCHNAHPQSPKHDFRLNDLMGGLEIEMPMDQYLKESQLDFLMTMVGGTALCLLVVGIVALGTRQTVTRPLATLARKMRELSGTSEEPPPETAVTPPGNEVAELTATFEQMQAIISAQQTQLRGANAQLEERVLERTRALQKSEEQLRHAQKMEAIGRLAGGIAHDFNNLLVVIKGYSETILRRLSHEDPLHMLAKEINEAGDRAAALTRQLLAFSRNQMLEPKVLDLNALVTDLDKMLRRVIGEDIDLVTVLEPALGRVEADLGQLEQVLMNLAVNARDAMPQGGELTIETANAELDENYVRQRGEAQPGSYVMLAVSDTGCGMDAQTQAHIFEPFFTTKEPGKGTGLGLSTVFGIIKQSGGNIWVYSEPGRGTTFKIYLPRLDREIKAAEGSEALAIPPRGSKTILVVEDEEKVLTLECSILRENGYTVLAARDGRDALRICREHPGPIHLLVTDVVMPDMNGRELAQQMAPLHPAMKVLYVSGYTDDAVIRHGVLEANTAFLQKPFASEVLLRKVCEVLNGSHASRQQGD